MVSMTTGMLLVSLPSSSRKVLLQGSMNGRVTGVTKISTSMLSAWKEKRRKRWRREGGGEGRGRREGGGEMREGRREG